MQLRDYGMGLECGSRLFERSSWKRYGSANNILRFRKWHSTFEKGFAFGPVMFWKNLR